MKTSAFKLSFRSGIGKCVLAAACLLGAALNSSATVTVQGWWHLDSTQPITDSSGNSRTFGSAYSTAPATGGPVAAQVVANGAGGPLDSTGWTSSECIRVGVGIGGKRQSSMWGLSYNPPATNFGIEIWVLPQDNGIAGGSGGWIFSSGQTGGVAIRVNAPSGAPSYINAFDLAKGTPIGDQVPLDTNQWMHLAIVNADGVTTFYTNGVPCGESATNISASAGDVYMISAPGDNQAFDGYLDEGRMFTFASGAFSTNDLLLRPPGPNIVGQSQSAVVWNGGAAPYSVVASFDNDLLYQWQRRTTNAPNPTTFTNILDATNSTYLLPIASLTDNGSSFDAIVTGSLSVTSAPAALTVVSPNTADVAAYQNLVATDPNIIAYFPVDGCTGPTVTNVINTADNGTLQGNAAYDGRTNRSFGQRALSFNVNGDVEVPTLPAYDFQTTGNGTIEALVYLNQATVEPAAIFSHNYDGGFPVYALYADPTGSFLVYSNANLPATLTWAVPGGLLNRFLDVAIVFANVTNVTTYVNGQSLGTQQQTGFGSDTGAPFWIGGIGATTTDDQWAGTIDELSVYKAALPASTLQLHYTKLVFGTNNVPPVIVSQSTSKTLLAGGSPQLTATVTGGLPIAYQWTSNSVPIAGATSSVFVLAQTKTNYSATYELVATNVFGATNSQPIVLTFTAPPSGYIAQVMSDNPTALWRLAETSGSIAADSAGLNDAVYTSNGVTYAAGGPPGDTSAGASFNGSSGRAATPGNFPDLNPNGPFTVEFWGRLTTYGFYVPLGSMDRPARTSGYEFYIDGNSPGYEFHTGAGGGYNMLCADDHAPADGAWDYVTGVWDTTNLYVYVNGAIGDLQEDPPLPAGVDNWETEGAPPFNPNTTFPFIIGSRSDNTHYYHGTLADVAVYDYALSPAQVSNHWSYGYVAASVVSSPVGVTNVEGSTITLTPVVTGVPNSYQWYLGNNALADGNNFDGTAHYPNDVTNLTLTIAEAKPSDSGQYHLVISNPLSNSMTALITVLVTPNTNAPAVSQVIGLGTQNMSGPSPYLVKVVFTQRVDPTTGGATASYSLSPHVAITGVTLLGSGQYDVAAAALGADWREAIIQTAGLTAGTKYTLTVSGVKDQSQTALTVPTATIAFLAPVVSTGVLNWDYYYLGNSSGGIVSALTGNYNYPNAPQTNGTLTAFDTDQITDGELSNNPLFGSLGDNYGDVVSGWLTPTVSGAYTFFLASDDASELDLSTDATVGNAAAIATASAYSPNFVEATNTLAGDLTSAPVNLTAGQAYYVRTLHSQGGGGDFVKVAWRISTDTTDSTNLPPISGSVLSAYATKPASFTTPTFSASAGTVIIPWSGAGTIQESADLKTWAPVPGNPNPLVITVSSASAEFFRIVQ